MSDSALSSNLYLLIQACLGGNVDESLCSMSRHDPDWKLMYDLSRDHQVSALLYDHLKILPHFEKIQVSCIDKLKQHSIDQAVFSMLFLRKSIELNNDLAQNNVNAFLMKGALWAWLLYDNPGLREFGDIDFFLQKEQISQGLDVLARHNFEPDAYRKYLLSKSKVAKLYFDTDYQLPLTPTGQEMVQSLEVQWNTTYPRYHFSFAWDELTQNMMSFTISGTTLRVPSAENQLLLMIIHHGGVEQWDKLKYMADLVRLLRKFGEQIDWIYIVKVTKEKGFYNILLESLGLVLTFTGENYLIFCDNNLEKHYPSKRFRKEVINHWENTRTKPVTKSWRIFYFNMINRDRLSDKLSILISHLAYMLEWRLMIPKARWYQKQTKPG